MQMAKTQESLIRNNTVTLDLGLKLRQTLGDHLILLLRNHEDPQALQAATRQYLALLDEGIEHERNNNLDSGFAQARIDYESFLTALDNAQHNTLDLSSDSELTNRFNQLRNGLIAEHRRALDNIYNAQAAARDRALIIALLLGLIGLAVLIIGFITAHGIARRFGCRSAVGFHLQSPHSNLQARAQGYRHAKRCAVADPAPGGWAGSVSVLG